MANHPSAEKRNRQRLKRTDRNRSVKSSVRTFLKSARGAIATATSGGAQASDASASVKAAIKALDRAASKGVIHKRSAARRKARLALALNKVGAAK
jgi:small subunit ribosomal protein S20